MLPNKTLLILCELNFLIGLNQYFYYLQNRECISQKQLNFLLHKQNIWLQLKNSSIKSIVLVSFAEGIKFFSS